MSRRRTKTKGHYTQRDNQKYSNQRLLRKIYDQNQQRRLKSARRLNRVKNKPVKIIDTMRRYQNIRALVFSPPKSRLKRQIRKGIKDVKLFNTRPIHDIICTSRRIRKYIMFAKGQIGHGTSKRRRKMTWTSKVRC